MGKWGGGGLQFSSILGQIGSSGGHEGQFSTDPLPVFSAGGLCKQLWHGQGCPHFDIVHPAFPLPVSSNLHGALKDGFGEAVVACDMPEPWECPSLDSCQKRFLWTHKEVDHPHRGVGLQVGDAEKFPQALGLESLDPFLRVSKQGPCLEPAHVHVHSEYVV